MSPPALFAIALRGVETRRIAARRPSSSRCGQAAAPPRGFTLVELLVVIAIIGALVAILFPAIQSARESGRRMQCMNNIRQLSLAMLSYESSKRGFVPMAKHWCNRHASACPDGYEGPGGWYDDHGWNIPLMPYLEQAPLSSFGDPQQSLSAEVNEPVRETMVAVHACPSDIGLQRSAWDHPHLSRVRSNYVVNAGNTTYGQWHVNTGLAGSRLPGPTHFLGAPVKPRELTPLHELSDGLSSTLLFSEIYVLPETQAWPGPYSDTQSASGGQTFTGWRTPNSRISDCLARVGEWVGPALGSEVRSAFSSAELIFGGLWPPAQGPCGGAAVIGTGLLAPPPYWMVHDVGATKQQYQIARSRHAGGVNASRCDASVQFYRDGIDPLVWNALSSAAGEEVLASAD